MRRLHRHRQRWLEEERPAVNMLTKLNSNRVARVGWITI